MPDRAWTRCPENGVRVDRNMWGVVVTRTLFKQFLDDEAGATAVEYSMFIGLFSLALMAMWATTEDGISLQFLTASDTLDGAPDVDQVHKPGGD